MKTESQHISATQISFLCSFQSKHIQLPSAHFKCVCIFFYMCVLKCDLVTTQCATRALRRRCFRQGIRVCPAGRLRKPSFRQGRQTKGMHGLREAIFSFRWAIISHICWFRPPNLNSLCPYLIERKVNCRACGGLFCSSCTEPSPISVPDRSSKYCKICTGKLSARLLPTSQRSDSSLLSKKWCK